ncbi:hypothetical protein SARC_07629 [Sphaeroforma arctica JP610]|uniref:Phosphoglucomutase n=1 Tax=Sphaeroforma arctica JP610 TaxID=667725 RepID=A0A0L0FT89_9EUKA|nr:hypothetical protein SARC_07629 [Sphaeroforma arctica JP610]KNC79997.1 hypothetical protein SARC_07629 [Sphaeroforma arctica JP610]|eukprot:XP_014153899.1 hypothetical protein SARC_07629 [Sphaeroforma arctica JP610]
MAIEAKVKSFIEETLPTDLKNKAWTWLEKGNLWECANIIGNYYNDDGKDSREACRAIIDDIRAHQGEKAKTSEATTMVVFGTSGWRGVIGEDFTCLNVAKTCRGIIEMMKTDDFLKQNHYTSFEEVKSNGILVFRDNRFMGDDFMDVAMRELAAEGIKIFFAGECPTGVGSALVPYRKLAGSFNFTPSHNPMDYAGLKFNPADGGPADVDLTSIIQEKANNYMKGGDFTPSTADFTSLKTDIDAAKEFAVFMEKNAIVYDMDKVRSWLKENKTDVFILIDNMHGSSRGYLEASLGDGLTQELKDAGALKFMNTDTDYSFHGVKPEPSAKNNAPLIKKLQAANRKYTLCAALDPDADRARFGDAHMDVDMNRFGAIAYGCILEHVKKGGIASTAPSSDFALEIAKKNGQRVDELAVGFKEFRPSLNSGGVIECFEESDGISFAGHTLDKCAMAGCIMAINTLVLTGKNLSEQYTELQKKYGYFYPDKAGADVKGVSVEAWQAYKAQVMQALQHKLYKMGDSVTIDGKAKEITSINIIDGLKVIFADRSWILLRASGTEPKFRYYYEVVSDEALPNDGKAVLDAYCDAAAGILTAARKIVDGN